MKKNILILFGMLLITSISFSQTTATDFTVNDCSGKSHQLFTELNEGKVVVMVWVMPCATCTGPAKTAHNIAKSYATSHPGRVVYYLVDDYANTNCTSLNSWGTSNVGTSITATFSNAAIKMTDYGSDGMPKVVVLGGKDHLIFFNKNNAASGNATEIQDAINKALLATGIEESKNSIQTLNVYPSPATNKTSISYTLKQDMDVKAAIFNILGEKVQCIISEKQNAGKHQYEINAHNLADGLYFVNVNGNIFKFQVAK